MTDVCAVIDELARRPESRVEDDVFPSDGHLAASLVDTFRVNPQVAVIFRQEPQGLVVFKPAVFTVIGIDPCFVGRPVLADERLVLKIDRGYPAILVVVGV